VKYAVPPATADLAQTFLPSRILFAPDQDGLRIHNSDDTAFYPEGPGGISGADHIAQQAGFADYAAMVATFDAASEYQLRIYDYISEVPEDFYAPPMDVDFRITSPKLTKTIGDRDAQGYVTRWDWAELVFDPDTGKVEVAAVVIVEHHAYTVVDNVPVKRDETIEWIRRNDTPHPDKKTREKFYNTPQSVSKEGQKRRGSILEEVLGTVAAWLLGNGYTYADGQALSAEFSKSITEYVRDTNPQLVFDIHGASSTTYPWIDQAFGDGRTVRAYMTDTLNIYGISLP